MSSAPTDPSASPGRGGHSGSTLCTPLVEADGVQSAEVEVVEAVVLVDAMVTAAEDLSTCDNKNGNEGTVSSCGQTG